MTHSGTTARRPASPGMPRPRAVFAGGGRCWVRTNVGLADGFTGGSQAQVSRAAHLQEYRPDVALPLCSTTPQPDPGPPVQLCPAGIAIARHVQLRRRRCPLAQPRRRLRAHPGHGSVPAVQAGAITRHQKQPGWAAADPAPLGARVAHVWRDNGPPADPGTVAASSFVPVRRELAAGGNRLPGGPSRMLPDPGCYEERHRLTGRAALGLAAGLLQLACYQCLAKR